MNKKAQSFGVLILIAVAVGIGIFIFLNSNSSNKPMITVNLYDAAGKVINQNLYSVVNGIPGVASMDVGVNVQNTGTATLLCSLSSLSPTAFNSAVAKTVKTIEPSATSSWASSRINTSTLESLTQPITFSATVTCNYTSFGITTVLPSKTGTVVVQVLRDNAVSGNFTVGLTTNAGGASSVCGDGICQADETSASCAADCAVASSVKFRTLNNVIARANTHNDQIAFTTTCGSALTTAGEDGNSWAGGSGSNCDSYMPTQGFTKVFNIPSNVASLYLDTYSETAATNVSLWHSTSTASKYALCGTSYRALAFEFLTTNSATTISTSATSIDPTKEVAC